MQEGAEKIIRQIREDTQQQVDALVSEANKTADRIIADAEEKAAGRKEQLIEKAEKEAAEQKRRILGVAQLEARKELLTAKQELIEKAFRESLQNLANLEEDKYFELIKKMLLVYAQGTNEEVIFSTADRARVPSGFLDAVNKELAEEGKKGKISLSEEERELQGGFILKSEGLEINCSFSSLLNMQRDELETEVASLLFS